MADISIIICTYNPDIRVFERCLDAVSRLKKERYDVEYLLVDNNSSPSLKDHHLVQEFLKQNRQARLIVEEKPGLTHARICGFNSCTAPVIVFFDDDNEPDEQYLIEAVEFLKRHPKAGVFSAGSITVEFVDGEENRISKYKDIYQHIELKEDMLGSDTDKYPYYYPYGTGMVVRREIMRGYADLLQNRKIETLGRKGKILTGGEDVQIVLLGILQGYMVGRTPDLKLIHLINKQKANFGYLKRLAYGGGLSSLPARIEIFPEEKERIRNLTGLSLKLLVSLCKAAVIHLFKPGRLILAVAWQAGYYTGIDTIKEKSPSWILRLAKLLTGLK